MRHISAVAAIFCYLCFLTACKKGTGSTDNNPLSEQRIPLTGDEADNLHALIVKGQVKSPSDFLEKIASIRASGKQGRVTTLTTYPADQAYPSTDDVADAGLVAGVPTNLQNIQVPFDILSRFDDNEKPFLRSFQTTFQEMQIFSIRRNQVLTEIPYIATVTLAPPNMFRLAALSKPLGAKAQIRPVGSHWGVVTQSGTNNYMNINDDAIDAHAEAQEERTIVRSTSGKIKISNTVDLELWKIGMEVEANFTVSSAENIYNQYTMNGGVKVAADGVYDAYIRPTFTTYSSIHCVDYGILLND